jgi:predicted nucleic acid-binding protein
MSLAQISQACRQVNFDAVSRPAASTRMNGTERFFDTSVLLYLLSGDACKADTAEYLLEQSGVITVQVLNEFTTVGRRKLKLSYAEIKDVLGTVRGICRVDPLTVEGHDRGIEIAQRYNFSFYDSVIVASALVAGCKSLYTEGLKHNQVMRR